MYPDQFFAIEQPISAGGGKRRDLRHWENTAAILLVCAASLVVLLAPARTALATIQTSGIVYAYFDDPITGNVTYGLPFFGNDVDYFPGVPPTIPDNAETFEYDAVAGPTLPNGGSTTSGDEIIVGKGARGDLVISGSSILRAEHLIIGDVGVVGSVDRGGLGIVRVTGFASTYNNDPFITALHPSVIGTSWTTIRNSTDGYDLYVGRGGGLVGGVGELEISAGGSMEIQDAVILAADPFTRATVNVDGFDSSLTSGGFDGGSANDPHHMIVGRQGIAFLNITTGATVISEGFGGPTGPGGDVNFGATIGSIPFEGNQPPGQAEAGGQGTVTVTGPASNWIIGGSLQIGGFHDPSAGPGMPNVSGELAQYDTTAGTGTLRINEGGFVSIRQPITPSAIPDLLLAIGRFGGLELNAGSLRVGDAIDHASADVELINDGVIVGSGRIDTGTFLNRYFGELRVHAGQTMIIAAATEFTAPPDPEPLLNFGLIEVIGTVEARAELEFERSPGTTNPPRPIKPLINRPVFLPPNPTLFIGGMINAQHATLRSGSGFQNEGIMAFTAGMNVIHGRVDQIIGPTGFIPDFRIGPFTTVVVEDDFSAGAGTLTLFGPGNFLHILDPGTFTSAGRISMTLSLSSPSQIGAAGDIGIGGLLDLTLASDVLADLAAFGPGRSYDIITFTGGAYQPMQNASGSWVPDYSQPIPDCGLVSEPCSVPGLFAFTSPDVSILGPAFDDVLPIAQRIGQSIVVTFVDLSSIGVTLVGDYNNDGVVDSGDYIIWRKYEGTSTMLPNDPFGGVIGSNQYDAWRDNFGASTPGSGAGSGLGAVVPEPTALALLVSGGMLALALRRRRLR